MQTYLIYSLGQQQYAIPITAIEQVTWMVEITPLHETSDEILGILNVQGQMVPVINIRYLLRLPQRDVSLQDRLIILQTASGQRTALAADRIVDLAVLSPQPAASTFALAGVAQYADALVSVHNLEWLLSVGRQPLTETME